MSYYEKKLQTMNLIGTTMISKIVSRPILSLEKLKDTKWVIITRKSKDRQEQMAKRKRTNTNQLSSTQKAGRIQLKSGSERMCPGSVSIAYSTKLVKNDHPYQTAA